MNILITGACGFLGRNLVTYLKKNSNHELSLLDKPRTLFDSDIVQTYFHDCVLYQYDLKDISHSSMVNILQSVDTVIHLANVARIGPSWEDYRNYYHVNMTISQMLYQQCQRNKVKRFIYVSSSSVYGNNGCLINSESDPCVPTSPYAVSKLGAEMALKVQSQMGITDLIIVRPFTMYGNYMDYGSDALVIAKFLEAYSKDMPLELHGGGTQTRDFLHSDDAVVGLNLILEFGKAGETYNLGSGKTVPIKDLAAVLSDKTVILPPRIGDVKSTHANIDKLLSLGYMPQHDVLEWLKLNKEISKIIKKD